MLHKKDQSRVKEVWYCAEEDKPIEKSEIEKGYDLGEGKYVIVSDEELKKIAPATATTMEVLQFVASDEVDPIYFEKSYYLASDEKTTKAFALFMAALSGSKKDAIAKLAMHNREHIVLIRPYSDGLMLHTLYYPDELHASKRAETPKTKYTAKELELAQSLIDHLTAPFKAGEFKDTYRENVERLIEEKRKGVKVTETRQPKRAPVVDLMEALQASLKASGTHATVKKAGHRKKSASRNKAA
jgi:DNA end-binding protein Ku